MGGTVLVDVLVVDDNGSSFSSVLLGAGYSVEEAENGAVALARLRSGGVASMVLDVRMPVLDGLGLLDTLSDPPPVILMTAHDYGAEVTTRRAKVFAYLQKPVLVPTAHRSGWTRSRWQAAPHLVVDPGLPCG